MPHSSSPPREPIAIVGATALHPGSTDAEGFWRDILAGRDLITEVPPHYWLIEDYYDPDPKAVDKTYGRRGAFLTPVEFDALEFGLPPNALEATDSAQLLGLIGAKRVLADAADSRAGQIPLDRVSVILGVAGATSMSMHTSGRLQRPTWIKGLREAGLPESEVQAACDRIADCFTPFQENTFPGLLGNVVAGRIANRFNLGGSNFTVDAACAGSLAALSVGLNELYLHQADMVITGGVDALNDILMFMCFSKTPALSPTGDCRPFSDKADGTMLGEGLSMFALRRLSDAERDGNKIYAVIRGLGASSDGRAKSVYAPRPEGQAVALRRAYAAAGFGPETVELVEAHGTGTHAGDAAEFEGLRSVFGACGREERQWCALGSLKSQIGHSKGAAGAAALFKAVMALHHKVLLPTIKVDQPNPKLGLENSPFYLNTQARPWIRNDSHPRRAAVSSFGFGGTNFHVVLEEYAPSSSAADASAPANAPNLIRSPVELLLLSGESAREIANQCREFSARLLGEADWRSLASELQRGFDARRPARLAILAESAESVRKRIDEAVARLISTTELRIWESSGFYFQAGPPAGAVAFLFSGQGSQYVGMGADLAMTFAPARQAWDHAETILSPMGFSSGRTVFPPPAFSAAERARQSERLTQTENAQPALATAALAHLALLNELGVAPDFTAGHSFGELVALHATGALNAEDLLRTALARGKLMAQNASAPGAMTAVFHSVTDLRALLNQWKVDVVLANHNSPAQAVLSGTVEAITQVEGHLISAGISFQRLRVSTAFHSPLVAESTAPFSEFLDGVEFASPQVPVFSNSEAAPYPSDPAAIRQVLAHQLARPVRFAEQIEALYEHGARTFIELGAGAILSKLVDQCLDGRDHLAVAVDQKGRDGVVALWDALGQLAAAGVTLQFSKLQQAFAPAREISPARNPASTFSVDGAGYNRPYPPRSGATGRPAPNPERETPAASIPAPPSSVSTSSDRGSSAPTMAAITPEMNTAQPAQRASASTGGTAWLEAVRELQSQISESQRAAQAAILESLSLTLSSMETLSRQFGAMADPPAALSAPIPAWPASPANPATPLNPAGGISIPIPSIDPAPPLISAAPARSASASPQAPLPVLEAPVSAAIQDPDLHALLLEVVAEKTGYPVDALNLDMELESGLGIDSIKRVEIFSAIQQRATGLPEVTPEEMAGLRTLREIIAFLAVASPVHATAASPPAPAEALGAPAASGPDLQTLLLAVVAEKTGYPADVLNLDMELESGLGIDSIKRVEIFSSIQERAAGLPQVTPEDMATLRTLREIIGFLDRSSPEAPVSAGPEPAAPNSASRDLSGKLLDCRPVHEINLPAPGLPIAALFASGPLVVTDDGHGIARALVSRLESYGIPAAVVLEPPADCPCVVFLGGLRSFDNPESAIAANFEAFRTVKTAAQQTGGPKLFVAMQDTGGDFGMFGADPLRAWSGGIAGIVKTAALEWPEASVKIIDLEQGYRNPELLAEAIAEELLKGGNQIEVGLHADGRRTGVAPVVRVTISGAEPSTVDEQSVIVASGGARGVTAACLIELARTARPRIALLGRTVLEPEPDFAALAEDEAALKKAFTNAARAANQTSDLAAISKKVSEIVAAREIRTTLAALERAGAPAVYLPVDIRNASEISKALEHVRQRWGPITGLVHGAGILADRKISEKSLEQFQRVFETKVVGLRTLLAATAADPLKMICLFSSVAARFGNAGQCDYAAANEVLNKVAAAESRRRPGCLVRSLAWGPWQGGMVTPSLAAHFHRRNIPLISIDAGSRTFVRELTEPAGGAVEIVIGSSLEGAPAHRRAKVYHAELLINSRTYPLLNGHRVKDEPVLAVVLVMEWFLRAAAAFRPELEIAACKDLRALKGVVLSRFDHEGHWLQITCREDEAARGAGSIPPLQCELRSRGGQVHYTATVELKAPGQPFPEAHQAPSRNESGSFVPAPHDFYRGDLFHGPEFQVLHSLDAMDGDGAHGTLLGHAKMGWRPGPWKTEAAGCDGALQLLLLWGRKHLGGPSLPTRLGRCIHYGGEPADGLIRSVVRCRKVGNLRTVSDVYLRHEDGRPIADLFDVEMHLISETTS